MDATKNQDGEALQTIFNEKISPILENDSTDADRLWQLLGQQDLKHCPKTADEFVARLTSKPAGEFVTPLTSKPSEERTEQVEQDNPIASPNEINAEKVQFVDFAYQRRSEKK